MPFDLGGTPHEMGYWQKISAKEYYDALRNGSVASTSQINPITYSTRFFDYAKRGEEAIFIVLSSGLSATYHNAMVALQEVKETYPDCGIFVIDSISATSGLGLLALMAAEKREEGFSAWETTQWLEAKKHRCIGLFTVDDLMYLHRGGRLSKLSAIAGSVLNIKPLLNLAPDGTLSLKDKVRGRAAALELMVSQLERSVVPGSYLDTIVITHTDSLDYARTLEDMVKAAVSVRRVIVMYMGPVIGAHLGPGAVTMIFEGDITRDEYESRFYPG